MPLTVGELLQTIEFFPKDAYVILPGDKCAEACYYTMEKDGDQLVKVVKII